MGLKGYRLWAMGQLDSTCRAPPRREGTNVNEHHVVWVFEPPDAVPDVRVANVREHHKGARHRDPKRGDEHLLRPEQFSILLSIKPHCSGTSCI
jgi:hypothetical protein